MASIIFKLNDGTRRTVETKVGSTVMETAIRNNVRGIAGECGGSCSCATCHVYVEEQYLPLLPVPDAMESDLLEEVASERKAGSRLSCQLIVTSELDGLTVQIPEMQS